MQFRKELQRKPVFHHVWAGAAAQRSARTQPLCARFTPSLMSFTRWRQLAGKHVVFGKVVSGFEVVEQMEAVGVPAGHDGEPTKTVLIFDCGLLP